MQKLLYIIILMLAFPAGYLLAYLARDELVAGRKWFMRLAGVSLVCAVAISFIEFSLKIPLVLTLSFIIVLCFMAFWKSKDKKWTK